MSLRQSSTYCLCNARFNSTQLSRFWNPISFRKSSSYPSQETICATLSSGLIYQTVLPRYNPKKKSNTVSCEGYEDDFLKEMGFQNRDSCVELNLALHRQYVDDCLKEIKSSGNESHDKKLLDLCVYHSFEKQAISLSSYYLLYRNKKTE